MVPGFCASRPPSSFQFQFSVCEITLNWAAKMVPQWNALLHFFFCFVENDIFFVGSLYESEDLLNTLDWGVESSLKPKC